MRRALLLNSAFFFCLLASTTSSYAFGRRACSVTPADQTAVADTIRTVFKAATQDDLPLFHTVVTPDFYAFDNGERFDGDALMQLVRKLHAEGNVFVWTVNDPAVLLGCNSALVTYVNRGSITSPKGTMDLTWLESAYMQKQDGHWRIRFFHSTRQQQPVPLQ